MPNLEFIDINDKLNTSAPMEVKKKYAFAKKVWTTGDLFNVIKPIIIRLKEPIMNIIKPNDHNRLYILAKYVIKIILYYLILVIVNRKV